MLVGLKEILAIGRERGIAVGSFNTPNSEALFAVLDAAETLDVPVIIAHAQCHDYAAPLEKIAPLMVAMAKRATVPVCVHLDHGEDFDYCARAIAEGFTSVMIDSSTLPYEENIALTARVTEYAHAHGVDVEAELGRMPSREGGEGATEERPEDLYTDPALVPDYLARTGADALAIAFGTAHGFYKVKPVLNMDIITAVKAVTDVPLVMHGGSGISHEEYRALIARGIGKINYYSYMSYAGYAEARACVTEKETGFYHDLALRVERAIYENVLETLKVFSGK